MKAGKDARIEEYIRRQEEQRVLRLQEAAQKAKEAEEMAKKRAAEREESFVANGAEPLPENKFRHPGSWEGCGGNPGTDLSLATNPITTLT